MKPPPSSPSVEPNRAKNPASAFYAGCFVSFVSVFSKRVLASLRPTPAQQKAAQQKAAGRRPPAAGRFVRLGAGVALGVRQQVQTASTARLHVEDANVVPKLISASRAGHPQSKRNSAPFARPGRVHPPLTRRGLVRVAPLVLVRMPLVGGGLTVVMSVTLVGLGLAVRVSGGA